MKMWIRLLFVAMFMVMPAFLLGCATTTATRTVPGFGDGPLEISGTEPEAGDIVYIYNEISLDSPEEFTTTVVWSLYEDDHLSEPVKVTAHGFRFAGLTSGDVMSNDVRGYYVVLKDKNTRFSFSPYGSD